MSPRADMDDSAEARDRFFGAAAQFTPLLAADSETARFIVSTSDEAVGRRLFRKGRRGEMVILANAISLLDALEIGDWVRGTTFLDVGGNVGTSAITALTNHEFCAAIA